MYPLSKVQHDSKLIKYNSGIYNDQMIGGGNMEMPGMPYGQNSLVGSNNLLNQIQNFKSSNL
jgi:hypothetical protein